MDFLLGYAYAQSTQTAVSGGTSGLSHDERVILGWVMLAAIPVAWVVCRWVDRVLAPKEEQHQ